MKTITLWGNLTKDADAKEVDGKRTAINFTVAVNDELPKANQPAPKPTYFRCVVWKDGIGQSKLAKLLTKGTRVLVIGDVDLHTYKAPTGDFHASIRVRVDTLKLAGSPKLPEVAPAPETSKETVSGTAEPLHSRFSENSF